VSGTHLWSQTYPRELKDVFTVQEEIAKDVAQALSIKLDVGGLNRAAGGTTNVEAYEAYLTGKAWRSSTSLDVIRDSIDKLQKAVTLDPGFAGAWLELSDALSNYAVQTGREMPKESMDALEHAGRLAPDLPGYQLTRALLELENFAWRDAANGIRSARTSALGNARATGLVDLYEGFFLTLVGRFKDSIPLLQEMKRVNPLDTSVAGLVADAYFLSGDKAAAQIELERGMQLPGSQLLRSSAFDQALSNRDRARMDLWIESAIELENSGLHLTATMKPLLDRPTEALAKLHRMAEKGSSVGDFAGLAYWAAYHHDPQFALELLPRIETFRVGRGRVLPRVLWDPLMSDVRQMPEFKDYVRKIGLVDYWHKYGWADLCTPVGKDDFECH
jgi:tetratricopeptide (TPR) repeat protein